MKKSLSEVLGYFTRYPESLSGEVTFFCAGYDPLDIDGEDHVEIDGYCYLEVDILRNIDQLMEKDDNDMAYDTWKGN